MYTWWVFVHLVGLFGFLIAHGVSVAVAFRLRKERDPARIAQLLELSSSSLRAFYVSLALLLIGGVVAGFMGNWWSQAWIWLSIVILILAVLAMFGMARPYYRRVGLVSRAMASGSTAVTPQQLNKVLTSRRPISVAVIGFASLALILYLMLFKPSLGLSAGAPAEGASGDVSISAVNLAFDTERLIAPTGRRFTMLFDNQESAPHNVSIYSDPSARDALFRGEVITGPRSITYRVGALDAGSYFFRCDVHPVQMTGTLIAE